MREFFLGIGAGKEQSRGHGDRLSVAGREWTMKWIVTTAIGLATLLSLPGPSWAQAAIDPHHFALATSDFPSGLRVIAAHVESNARITRDRVLHFGRSFKQEGRLTGYFMDAVEGNRRLPRVDMSYVVSIFSTATQAADAFDEQQYYWDALANRRDGGPAATQDQYGVANSDALYSFQAFDGWTIFEHLFYYDQVFVEIFLELRIPDPRPADMNTFQAVGTTLDALCRDL
jgi:hypothetical protein